MVKNFLAIILFLGLQSFHPSDHTQVDKPLASAVYAPNVTSISTSEYGIGLRKLYDQFPAHSFSWDAFRNAMIGRQILMKHEEIENPDILTIIDFSKPSTEKRFYVIDVNGGQILFSSLTAHGQNTGENLANNFSNQPESHQSSLGFFRTAETYYGSKGFSLRLDGLEKGINNNARARAIVIHGAPYVSNDFIQAHGRLGRSYGCPALPTQLTTPIINKIKGGSILYIYADNAQYRLQSNLYSEIKQLF